jgi:hypothetical protein
MSDPRLLEVVDRKRFAEVRQQESSALSPRHADRPAEDINGNLVPALGSGEQDCLLIERLGIEKQAIHVENDGGWRPGQLRV